MDAGTIAPAPGTASSAELAKAALRRLVMARLEPTPENFERAYRAEAGQAGPRALESMSQSDPPGAALAGLIERMVRGLERGGRQWTSARRKESLQRVLAGSRIDPQLLQRRLTQLVASWEGDGAEGVEPQAQAAPPLPADAAPAIADEPIVPGTSWAGVVTRLAASLQGALAQTEGAAGHLAESVEQALARRERLLGQLTGLCVELTEGLSDMAEDDSWAQGQLSAMRQALAEGLTSRGVRSAGELLRKTREQQGRLREERSQARDALKGLINQMLGELGELGSHTGRFQENVGRYAEAIDKAESLESLTSVVGDMLSETRSVQERVGQTQARLQNEHARATALSDRVTELESELRRLSDEVSTDQLTQVANRRGLMQAFETARAQAARDGQPLAIGLLDVDNFKRLNDELGHSAGDVALRSLAGVISKSLRPADAVARFGGEEFVVLLPSTPIDEGQQILTRLQRSLSVGLFMHEHKTVFVTFSAGVTTYRPGETLEQALERADAALYEAKRTGKNRTCIG